MKYLQLGFSLLEILVSLMIVSLVAVNISGLQKLVADQSRDNFSHASVIALVTEQFETIMQLNSFQDLINLSGTSVEYPIRGTLFTLTWQVKKISGASDNSLVRHVEACITWSDAIGETQIFTYAEQISQAMLLAGDSKSNDTDFPYMIPNLLNTTKVGYFESNMSYQQDAYVIFDSQLFQASDSHPLNGEYSSAPSNTSGEISAGWVKLGTIDDHALASLFVD